MQKKILIILTLALLPLICLFTLTCGDSGGGSSGGDIDNDNNVEEHLPLSYTITFYKNGEVFDYQVVKSGAKAQRPVNPEGDENLRFVGWYENPNFTKRFIFNKNVDSDVNLYARFINISYIPIGEETTVEEIENSTIFISGRDITIPSLYVCDHETTQAEWGEYMKIPSGLARTGDNYPIHKINWYECIMYCNLRSEAEGLVPAYYITVNGEDVYDVATWMRLEDCINADENDKFSYESKTYSNFLDTIQCNVNANGYRIPTEAEWEFFARGGSANNATYKPLEEYAWCNNNAGNKVHEIKQKSPNTLGIYDILGNVSEMCFDRFDEIDINTPITGANAFDENGNNRHLKCVRRGGCYVNTQFGTDTGKDGKKYPTGCNINTRGQPKAPYERSDYGGLRVICTAN